MIANANSGQVFNIVSNFDLNNDTLFQDRPVGVTRNSGTTPPLFNLDFRYSRFVSIRDRTALEIFAEFTNLLNNCSIVQFNNVSIVLPTVTANSSGNYPTSDPATSPSARKAGSYSLESSSFSRIYPASSPS